MGYSASKREHRRANSPKQLKSEPPETHERKRIPVACTRCRKRKIKCSGDTGGGCENCKAVNEECVFNRVGVALPVQLLDSSMPSQYNQGAQFLPLGISHQQALNYGPGFFASIPLHTDHPYGAFVGSQSQEFPHQEALSRQPSMQSISYNYNDPENESFSIPTYGGGPIAGQSGASINQPYGDSHHSSANNTRGSSISSESNRVTSNSYSSASSGQSSFNDRHLPIPGLTKRTYGTVPVDPVKCIYTTMSPLYADYNMGAGYVLPQTQSSLPQSPNCSPMTKPFSHAQFWPQYSYPSGGMPVHRKASVPPPTLSAQPPPGFRQLPSMAVRVPSYSSTGCSRDYSSMTSPAQQTPEMQQLSQPVVPSNAAHQYHSSQNYQRGNSSSTIGSTLCNGRAYVPLGVHVDDMNSRTQTSSPTARLIPCPRQMQRKCHPEPSRSTPSVETE